MLLQKGSPHTLGVISLGPPGPSIDFLLFKSPYFFCAATSNLPFALEMIQPLVVDVSGTIGREYVPLAEDLARTAVIQILVHVLVSAVDDSSSFFSAEFAVVFVYVMLGVAAYHLLLKRSMVFE